MEISPEDELFCQARAKGIGKSIAYRLSRPDSTAAHDSIGPLATKVGNRPEVKHRLNELVRDKRIADIDSVGEAWTDLKDDLSAARQAENYTAVANLTKQRLTGLGALNTHHTITVEQNMDDNSLIAALASNQADRDTLKRLLGAETFDGEYQDISAEQGGTSHVDTDE